MQRDETALLGGAGEGPAGRDDQVVVGVRARLVALVLLAVQLTAVCWLILRPAGATWVEPANFELFSSIETAFDAGPREALVTVGGGLLILAPLGFLLPVLGSRLGGSRFTSFTRTVFTAAMIALACELLRSVAPSQMLDVDRLLLATCGVALTHQLGYGPLRRRLLSAPSPASLSSGAPRSLLGQEGPVFPQGTTPAHHRVGLPHGADVWSGSQPLR